MGVYLADPEELLLVELHLLYHLQLGPSRTRICPSQQEQGQTQKRERGKPIILLIVPKELKKDVMAPLILMLAQRK